MTPGAAKWQDVGDEIRRSMESRHMSKADLIRESGVGRATLDKYLAGQPIVSNKKLWSLCAALGWTDDSVDRILRGEEPMMRATAELDAQDHSRADVDQLMVILNKAQQTQRSVIDELARRAASD